MRKTKCKECINGVVSEEYKCEYCQGTGEISVYTIQELRDGKVVAKSDGDAEISARVMNYADKTNGNWAGYKAYYWFENGIGTSAGERPKNLPIQSVKIFLEEIEQEEKEVCTNTFYCSPAKTRSDDGTCANCGLPKPDKVEQFGKTEQLEPEFKWGEEVECSNDGKNWYKITYCCIHPLVKGLYIVVDEESGADVVAFVRKPQKITLTLSQIAEKFNCKPEQIEIPDYGKQK